MRGISSVAGLAAVMLAATTAGIFSTDALAQARGGYYSAVPAKTSAKASFVTRSAIWKCQEGGCTAPRAEMRDAVMCELVAREIGTLSAFRAGETEFSADALAKCNAKAR